MKVGPDTQTFQKKNENIKDLEKSKSSSDWMSNTNNNIKRNSNSNSNSNSNTKRNSNSNSNSNSNFSTPPSNFGNILKYVKGKFPSFILFLHICISKYVFICESEISVLSDNSTQIIYIEDDVNNYVFWIYFAFISVICFIWELLYHLMSKYKCNKNKKCSNISKTRVGYSIMSSFISLIAFQSTVFYMDDHEVFNCFMDYNETIVNVIFFLTYGVILLLAAIEHYFYPNFSKT